MWEKFVAQLGEIKVLTPTSYLFVITVLNMNIIVLWNVYIFSLAERGVHFGRKS